MARTLDQLFTSYSPDECKQRLLDRCTAKGLPITDWSEGGVARTLIEIEAQENSDFSLSNVEIAKAAFFESSPGGDWTSLDAKDWFSTPRNPATYFIHQMVAVNNGSSAITVVPGQLWAANSSGLRFFNTNGGTVTAGNSLFPEFKAEHPGAAYSQEPYTLLTPIPGLTINDFNETMEYGIDEETDLALKNRCYLKWSTLGAGMNDDAYIYWCKSYQNGLYCGKVKVVTANTGTGYVTVYVSPGAYGPQAATLQAFLRTKSGNAINVQCADCTTTAAAVTVQMFGKPGCYFDTGKARANLQALIASLEIGEILYKAQIIECFMIPTMSNVVVSVPTGDINPGPLGIVTYLAQNVQISTNYL